MIVVGIDEAGYGPLLGPLVVTGVSFSVAEAHAGACLWEVLAESVCRAVAAHDPRLPIGDSKKLYNRKSGLKPLEQAALTMLQVADRKPGTLRRLLGVVAPGVCDELDSYPWYAGYDVPLPRATTGPDIATRANAVQRDLNASGIGLTGVFSDVVLEGRFNRLVGERRNKASVLMGQTLRLVHRLVQRENGQVRVCVDRHGGRIHYVPALMAFFDGGGVRIVEESDFFSAYEVQFGGKCWSLEFVTKGDDRHLPIALASIYSKYLRELMMEALNGYFGDRVQGLRPTAGYYMDGRRFLADVEDVVRAEGLDRSMLVRCR